MLINERRKIYCPIYRKTCFVPTTYTVKSGEIKLINPDVLNWKYVINNELGYIEFENVDKDKYVELEFEYDALINNKLK